MKLALNGATTMKADLPTDLVAASAAGFEFLEIWAAKLRNFLARAAPSDLRSLFNKHGIHPLSINSIEHITFRDADAYAWIEAECESLSLVAAWLNCPYIVVVPGEVPPAGASREEIIEESVRVLRELGHIAGRHGVALGFEFLGQPRCSVQTLDLANQIVTRVDRENIGLVMDSFHFYAGGSSIEMIEALDPRKLFIFHVNDAEDLPRTELEDRHRLLPGLGILPLKEMFAALRSIGYDGFASVEIFRPEYWEREPIAFAREVKAALDSVV